VKREDAIRAWLELYPPKPVLFSTKAGGGRARIPGPADFERNGGNVRFEVENRPRRRRRRRAHRGPDFPIRGNWEHN
jgi:hypothetical protein